MSANKNDVAWESLFLKYNILRKIEKEKVYKISSKQINEFRESRLMTKFDHSSNLPKLFSDNNLSILPITRGDYVLGHFENYLNFNDREDIVPVKINFPLNIESIDFNNIFSEATAINCAFLTNILNDILGEECVPTVSGRMSTTKFDFKIKNILNDNFYSINVIDSQCEIDGGYESNNCLMLIEAKNYSLKDFLIRQLYYPYRLWSNKIRKQVLPTFLTYSDDIFTLSIYNFEELENYNSIQLIKQNKYKIITETIELDEIVEILNAVIVIPEPPIPFPQADSFIKVLDLLRLLSENDMTVEEISTNFDFDPRQASYYLSAGQYLGIFEKRNKTQNYGLTLLGKKISNLKTKYKNLEIVRLILQHDIFNKVLQKYLEDAKPVLKDEVKKIMVLSGVYNVENDSTIHRRSQTVIRWIEWILNITK